MSYFQLSNGEQLYYEDTLEGEQTLVMMHGWSSRHVVYKPTVMSLRDQTRCIIYDHRGHGKSRKANREQVTMTTLASDLHELLVSLDLVDVNLLGWSMGAGVAMTYLEQFGTERLRQIILCDMSPKLINDDEWKLGMFRGTYTAEDMARETDEAPFTTYKMFIRQTVPSMAKLSNPLLTLMLRLQLFNFDMDVLLNLASDMRVQDHRDTFANVDIPITYFYADPGSLFSPELSTWYEQHVPSLRKTVRFEKASHMLVVEHPQKFANEVAALL